MTKRGIIDELKIRRHAFSHRQVTITVNVIFEEVARALARGERVEIRGFGSFSVRSRSARRGRNPKTGEPLSLPPRAIPFFRAGSELRLQVNGGEGGRS